MNCTDAAGQSPGRSEEIGKLAGSVLAGVAKHLEVTSPSDVLAPDALRVCVAAEAYVVAGRNAREAEVIAEAALAAVPEAPAGVTRGKYAELLRKAADACKGGQA